MPPMSSLRRQELIGVYALSAREVLEAQMSKFADFSFYHEMAEVSATSDADDTSTLLNIVAADQKKGSGKRRFRSLAKILAPERRANALGDIDLRIVAICEAIRSSKDCHQLKDIFRVSCSQSALASVMDRFFEVPADSSRHFLQGVIKTDGGHFLPGMLKHMLVNSRNSRIFAGKRTQLITRAIAIRDKISQLHAIQCLLLTLSHCDYRILCAVLDALSTVSKHAKMNRMSCDNLARCLTPTLIALEGPEIADFIKFVAILIHTTPKSYMAGGWVFKAFFQAVRINQALMSPDQEASSCERKKGRKAHKATRTEGKHAAENGPQTQQVSAPTTTTRASLQKMDGGKAVCHESTVDKGSAQTRTEYCHPPPLLGTSSTSTTRPKLSSVASGHNASAEQGAQSQTRRKASKSNKMGEQSYPSKPTLDLIETHIHICNLWKEKLSDAIAAKEPASSIKTIRSRLEKFLTTTLELLDDLPYDEQKRQVKCELEELKRMGKLSRFGRKLTKLATGAKLARKRTPSTSSSSSASLQDKTAAHAAAHQEQEQQQRPTLHKASTVDMGEVRRATAADETDQDQPQRSPCEGGLATAMSLPTPSAPTGRPPRSSSLPARSQDRLAPRSDKDGPTFLPHIADGDVYGAFGDEDGNENEGSFMCEHEETHLPAGDEDTENLVAAPPRAPGVSRTASQQSRISDKTNCALRTPAANTVDEDVLLRRTKPAAPLLPIEQNKVACDATAVALCDIGCSLNEERAAKLRRRGLFIGSTVVVSPAKVAEPNHAPKSVGEDCSADNSAARKLSQRRGGSRRTSLFSDADGAWLDERPMIEMVLPDRGGVFSTHVPCEQPQSSSNVEEKEPVATTTATPAQATQPASVLSANSERSRRLAYHTRRHQSKTATLI